MKKQDILMKIGADAQGKTTYLLGYTEIIDVAATGMGSVPVFTNFFVQMQGLASLIGQKNKLLCACEEEVILYGLTRFARRPKGDAERIRWSEISSVGHYRETVAGNDRVIEFLLRDGTVLRFELNIRHQQTDMDEFIRLVGKVKGTDISDAVFRMPR